MSRPIWKGSISFGLISIPITLYSAEKPNELHFHLIDRRNKARVRYERVNAETGKEVPWENIEKAFEFEKGNYVVVDEKELEKTAYESSQSVELEAFVPRESLDPIYFERPYYMIPAKQGEKGYQLLRTTLERAKKIGIAKVVIKTRQYLAAILPYQNSLLLELLHYPNEIRSLEEFNLDEIAKRSKIAPKEIQMAERLVKSMSVRWNPKKYHDENRELLSEWIENKIKHGKYETRPGHEKKTPAKSGAGKGAKVIDFMQLLKKSVAEKEGKGKGKNPKTKSRKSSKSNKRKSG